MQLLITDTGQKCALLISKWSKQVEPSSLTTPTQISSGLIPASLKSVLHGLLQNVLSADENGTCVATKSINQGG